MVDGVWAIDEGLSLHQAVVRITICREPFALGTWKALSVSGPVIDRLTDGNYRRSTIVQQIAVGYTWDMGGCSQL